MIDQFADRLGRRITLMSEDRTLIHDSSDGPALEGTRPSATVDPLRINAGLAGSSDRIDPRVVGPYRIPAGERRSLDILAREHARCLRGYGLIPEIVVTPSGRPVVRLVTLDPKNTASLCPSADLLTPTRTEQTHLDRLATLTATCLNRDPQRVEIQLGFTIRPVPADEKGRRAAEACVLEARQQQLAPYVAPPALLFVTDPEAGVAQTAFNLSTANVLRICAVTAAVLAAAVLATVLVGRRLVRPLQELTDAVGKSAAEQFRVPVRTQDEIGRLATALNDLSARREELERQRKAMVSDIAHELRSPLTNIRSWLEAAQDGLAPADARLLSLLLDEAAQLQHVIDDLRDLAAADAGRLRIHPEPVWLTDIIRQVTEVHRGAAEAGGVVLHSAGISDIELFADPVRLRQLLGNLVGNAVRYTPPGGSVTLEAGLSGNHLLVTVTDTGIGIAAEDLPRIFERFWRADASRTRGTGGSGLGLAIARQLAQAHHGEITVASRPGTGSRFTVHLPTSAGGWPVSWPAPSRVDQTRSSA
ncbi:HAMP domain-containing sensor histidine kinase [Actinoplanes sp. NPDC023936]|uniref:sensor histidine kinase n=1 Tax=Actinoplanes sp. NPDC023936 TaxID=3154910 RepID=UPI0033F8D613